MLAARRHDQRDRPAPDSVPQGADNKTAPLRLQIVPAARMIRNRDPYPPTARR